MSLCTFHIAKSGSEVVAFHGRQLSSFVDPEHEARAWCEHYREPIQHKKSLLVLGLAAGHHVRQLMREFTGPLIVVEVVPELRARWQAEGDHAGVVVLGREEVEAYLQSGKLELPMGVLTFAPAMSCDLPYYKSLYDRLNGRHAEALRRQFELRGQNHFFLPSDLNFNNPRESYRRLAALEGVEHKWKALLQLLGEVVK